jgi:histidine triad (HIT) family protein
MNSCVFCEIIAGKIPGKIVLENEHCIVLLPIDMEAKGHCLVIPKKHVQDIYGMTKEDLHYFIETVQEAAELVREKLGATGVNILNASGKDAQQSVFHLHFHIIPRYPNDGIDAGMKKRGDFTKEIDEICNLLTK